MLPSFALVLLAFVHNDAVYIEYQDTEDDQSDDADFDDQYESEDIITAPTRTTSEDPTTHTRIRRFGDQNPGARTLSLDEIQDVKGAIKELLAGHQMNLITTYNTKTTTDYTSPEYEVLTKEITFPGSTTKTGLEDPTNFYDDVIRRIIKSAKRQGLLLESTTQFQTQSMIESIQTVESSDWIFILPNTKIELKPKRTSDVSLAHGRTLSRIYKNPSLPQRTKKNPKSVQHKKTKAIPHISRMLSGALQDFDGIHYGIPDWIHNIAQLTQITPERTRGMLTTLKTLFPLDDKWRDKRLTPKIDENEDRKGVNIGRNNGERENSKEDGRGLEAGKGDDGEEGGGREDRRGVGGIGEEGEGENGGQNVGKGEAEEVESIKEEAGEEETYIDKAGRRDLYEEESDEGGANIGKAAGKIDVPYVSGLDGGAANRLVSFEETTITITTTTSTTTTTTTTTTPTPTTITITTNTTTPTTTTTTTPTTTTTTTENPTDGSTEGNDLDETEGSGLDETKGSALDETEASGLDEKEGNSLDDTEGSGLDETKESSLDGTKGSGLDEKEGSGLDGTEESGLDETEGSGLGEDAKDGSGDSEEISDEEVMFSRSSITTTTTIATTKKFVEPHYYPYPYSSKFIPNTTTSNGTTLWRTRRRRTTTKPTTTTTMPPFDIPALVAIISNLTNNFESDITDKFNKTLQKYNIPTCPNDETTETPIYYDLVNATVVSKCFVCGMTETEIPRDTFCSDAFSIDFIPLVPMDPQARGRIVHYRKYCRYLDVDNFYENATEPRSVYGRFTGGCSVRWIDISSVYTQRACRNRRHATTGRHFASKRMAKLEMALHDVENGCIISPMATLIPLSRGISLYARFHACVCTGSWCNVTAENQPWIMYNAILIFWSATILVEISVGGGIF